MSDNARDILVIKPGKPLKGEITVPGDKSISHRVVLMGALANGVTEVRGWLAAGDTEATLGTVQSLGIKIERQDANTLTIHGGHLQEPPAALDFVNAGTGIRLAAGIMAGQSFSSTLDGSAQLRRRPMDRIIEPLRAMGANIHSSDMRCPLFIEPAALQGIRYELPVASAQVKSCLLLAGLFAEGSTTVVEPGPARDHTERILASMGVDIDIRDNEITITPGGGLQPLNLTVPGDFSSAAFLIVGGLITPGSDLTIQGVNLNSTRTGLLDVLNAMGADITVTETGTEAGESVGTIQVRHSELNGIEIDGDIVVRMIDEFPVLMVAALFAAGDTIVSEAEELRVKETDRIAVMAAELRKLGARIVEYPDGFKITGRQSLTGSTVDGHDDHRVAMSLTIAGLAADGVTTVMDAACVHDSFPGFAETLQQTGVAVGAAD